jgi:hypothetical protein
MPAYDNSLVAVGWHTWRGAVQCVLLQLEVGMAGDLPGQPARYLYRLTAVGRAYASSDAVVATAPVAEARRPRWL